MKKYILLIFILFTLTGCYSYKELNTIAITSAIEVDKQNDEFILRMQVMNPQDLKEGNIKSEAPFIIYEGKDKTIMNAGHKLETVSSRLPYLYHMQILLLKENVLYNDLDKILDFLIRDQNIRNDFYIIIEKNNNDLISLTTPIVSISANAIKETLITNSKYYSTTLLVEFKELISNYLNPNIELVLPSIEIIDNTNEDNEISNTEKTSNFAKYKLSTLGIFKQNKFIGYLTEEESVAYNFISGKINNYILQYQCNNDKYIALDIVSNKTSIELDNKKIIIKINSKANINQVDCNINIKDSKVIKEMENKANKELYNQINTSLTNIITKYNSDIFGFKDIYYKKNYKYYKEIKDNYYEHFKNLDIDIKTNVKIISEGNTVEGINEKN